MNLKLLTLLFSISFLICSYHSFSQTKTDSIPNKQVDTSRVHVENKLNFGCGFGLNFVGGTTISLAPNLTYNLSDKVALGLGLQWNYLSLKDIQKTTTYGINTLFQYKPTPKLMTVVEFAQLRVSTKSELDDSKRNFWDSALFLGAGINVTKNIVVGAKYNFLYKEDESIYSSPVIPFVNITF